MTKLTEEQLRQCGVFANASEETINNLIDSFHLIAINKKKRNPRSGGYFHGCISNC